MAREKWKDIPGYEGLYQVSDQGRVRSLQRIVPRKNGKGLFVRGRIRKNVGRNKTNKPLAIMICKDCTQTGKLVHRLVWEAFNGPLPSNLEINHKNGRKQDNRLSNLEVITHKENMEHASRMGFMYPCRGELNASTELTDQNVMEIKWAFKKTFVSKVAEISRKYKVSENVIKNIVSGSIWKHICSTK